MYMYICIYIYICVCVCVSVCVYTLSYALICFVEQRGAFIHDLRQEALLLCIVRCLHAKVHENPKLFLLNTMRMPIFPA